MLKIAYVLADFPVFSETFIGDEMRAMEALGHTLLPIVLRRRREPGQLADQDLAERAIRLSTIKGSLSHLKGVANPRAAKAIPFLVAQKRLTKRSLFWNALKIASLVRKAGCEHIHAHFSGGAAAHAIVAARLANVSVSFICHGHDVYSEAEDLALKVGAADFVIATCEDMASTLRTMAPRARVFVSYCGIDPSVFFSRQADCNGRLLFVGRLVPQKGIDDILHAMARLDAAARCGIDIVGDGPQGDALRELGATLGLPGDAVRFLGPKPRSWFAENGQDYLALIAPFKTGPKGERDSGPTVVKEAMALGLPVISTRYMGVKEMIPAGAGLLVETGDVDALARAITTALSWTADDRAAITKTARERLHSMFTLERQANDLTGLIKAAQAIRRPVQSDKFMPAGVSPGRSSEA